LHSRSDALWLSAALAVFAAVVAAQSSQRAEAPQPLFSFAVLADVQYADKDRAGARDYRNSLAKLEESAGTINMERPAFVVHLGDLIDEAGAGNLDRVLTVFNRLQAPKHHVLGNHDFSVARAEWLRRLKRATAWYDVAHRGWRFVVLDGMDVSVLGWPRESPRYRDGQTLQGKLQRTGSRNAVDWNGGVGEEQKKWLHQVLRSATRRRERVVLLCHFPVLEAASTPAHLLWNHEEILRILDQYRVVVAWFNGHAHRGGYARRNGVHHITFPGMVESGQTNSWTMVRVFADRLELLGAGTAPSLTLRLEQ
jgi:calcineurin-like phosphoesterase family protein